MVAIMMIHRSMHMIRPDPRYSNSFRIHISFHKSYTGKSIGCNFANSPISLLKYNIIVVKKY